MTSTRWVTAVLCVLGLGLAFASGAEGQYTGTFNGPSEPGRVMTLVLREEAGGALGGSFTSNGIRYEIEGQVEDGLAFGSMSSPQGALFFEAERWQHELWLMLFAADARGEPNYGDYTEVAFVEAGAAADGVRPRPRVGGVTGFMGPRSGARGVVGNPMAGGVALDPYVGSFSDGNVTLTLQGGNGRYQGQVVVGGVAYPVQTQGGPQGIQGMIEAPDGQYGISVRPQGQGLFVASGGMQYHLVRLGTPTAGGGVAPGPPIASGSPTGQGPPTGAGIGRTRTGRELAPGFTEDHAQVSEWIQFLSGQKLTTMESYSSGGAGGYSARTDIYLCSDRSFAVRDESSVSVDVGGAFGNSGGVEGAQGQWYVITNGQVVGLILEFVSGEARELRMDYDPQAQATYANGTRVYVTPAEVCFSP